MRDNRKKYTEFFSKSTLGKDWFSVRKECTEIILKVAKELAIETQSSDLESPINPVSSKTHFNFLDGGVSHYCGDYFFGRKGTWVHGINALRLLCYKLDLTQPRKRAFEKKVLSREDILAWLNSGKEQSRGRKKIKESSCLSQPESNPEQEIAVKPPSPQVRRTVHSNAWQPRPPSWATSDISWHSKCAKCKFRRLQRTGFTRGVEWCEKERSEFQNGCELYEEE
jgi:hypothetical protein